MNPSLPIPTDNIYKFTCIFGLSLIMVTIFSYSTFYASMLDRKVKYTEAVIVLEAKQTRTSTDEEMLKLNKQLLEVTKQNEKAVNPVFNWAFGFGVALTIIGGLYWYIRIQTRDDKIAHLQIIKLEEEIRRLSGETAPEQPGSPDLTG